MHNLGDRQFECIRKAMESLGIMVNVTGRDEHVPKAEGYISTIKERVRTVANSLQCCTNL